MRLALFATLLLAGCASSRTIDVSRPAEIAAASAAAVGRPADVTLTSGDRYRGEVQFLRLDSTGWADDEAFYAVPTSDVRSLLIDTRRRALGRGAFAGGSLAVGLCYASGMSAGSGRNTVSCVLSGMLSGVIGGALTGGRFELVFEDGLAPTRAAAAGSSE